MNAAMNDVGAIILFVEDLARSKAFYHDVLGFKVEFEDDESVGFKIKGLAFIALQVDRARVQLQGEPTATPRAGATAFLTTFSDDVDALHADLAERGIEFFQNPTNQPWGVRTAYFKDPDGHVWEIAQPIDQSQPDEVLLLPVATKSLNNLIWAFRGDSDHGAYRVRERHSRHI